MAQSGSATSPIITSTLPIVSSVPKGCLTDDNSVYFGLTAVPTGTPNPTQLANPRANAVGYKIFQGKIVNRSGKQGYVDSTGKLRFDDLPLPLVPLYVGLFSTCPDSGLTLGSIRYWFQCEDAFTSRYVPDVSNATNCSSVWLLKMQVAQIADTTTLSTSKASSPSTSANSATASTLTKSSNNSSGFSGTIAGILAGGIIGFVIVIATGLYMFRRRKMKRRNIPNRTNVVEMADQPRKEVQVTRPIRHLNSSHTVELYGSAVTEAQK